jgi:hypothetical protein
MSFLFKACFEPQVDDFGSFDQKQYHPKVDLLPTTLPSRRTDQQPRRATIVANKLRARGNFDKPNMHKDYEELALQTEMYR